MNRPLEMATSEINRVGVWALRSLGMSFGVAERAGQLLAWAEAVEGGALRGLRLNEAVLVEAANHRISSRQFSPQQWKLDANGKSLLEVGPVAVDLLTCAGRNAGFGRVDILGVIDPVYLSGLCRMVVRRGLGCLVLATRLDLTLGGAPVSCMSARTAADGVQLYQGAIPPNLSIDAHVRQWIGSERERQSSARSQLISLFSYVPTIDERALPCCLLEVPLEDRFIKAQAHGVMVDKEDMDHLYGLEIKTWAPTSERSRKQALF